MKLSTKMNQLRRQGRAPSFRPNSGFLTIPAGIMGLNYVDSIDKMKPAYSLELDNFLPQEGRLEFRKGSTEYDNVNDYTGITDNNPVISLVNHSDTLIAITTTSLYNTNRKTKINSSDLNYRTGINASEINSVLWHGYTWICCNNNTQAPIRLNPRVANQWENTEITFNFPYTFSSEETSPASSSEFIQAFPYKNRLWFVEEGNTRLWYTPLNAAASGELSSFDIGEVAGGLREVKFLTSLTYDSGEGIDDTLIIYCIDNENNGRILQYSGIDPEANDGTGFRLKGNYDVAVPVGSYPWLKFGGDVLVLTDRGILSLSSMLSGDPRKRRVSNKIDPKLRDYALNYKENPFWFINKLEGENLLLINVPQNTVKTQFALNLTTGAWSSFSGWNINCVIVYEDKILAGFSNGRILELFNGITDISENETEEPLRITGRWQSAYRVIRTEHVKFEYTRPFLETQGNLQVNLNLLVNYERASTASLRENAITIGTSGGLGTSWEGLTWANWRWGSPIKKLRKRFKTSANGNAVSVVISVISQTSIFNLYSCDVLYSGGGFFDQ